VQRLAVEAAVTGNDELLRQAMMMDPLVGAVCNPPEIWQMVDEMLVAQARWLPQYRRAIAAARRRLAKGPLIPTRRTRGAARVRVRSAAEMARHAKRMREQAAAADKAAADRQRAMNTVGAIEKMGNADSKRIRKPGASR
jgi:alpha-galactosidase